MSELSLPKSLTCSAWACSKPQAFHTFCQGHLDAIPGPLRYEFERAKASVKRNGRWTRRIQTAFENILQFLATKDREHVLLTNRIRSGTAKEAELLADADERLAAAREATPRKIS